MLVSISEPPVSCGEQCLADRYIQIKARANRNNPPVVRKIFRRGIFHFIILLCRQTRYVEKP